MERAAASSVGDGDGAPLAQLCDQLVVDAALQALDVGGVDQELGAVGLEEADALFEHLLAASSPTHFTHSTQAEDQIRGRTLVQLKVGDGLPLVGGDKPLIVLAATRQVDDELVLVVVQCGEDGAQARHAEDAVWEEVRGDDDLLRSISPVRVLVLDACLFPLLSSPIQGSTHSLCAPLDPLARIRLGDAAAHLHAALPRLERLLRRSVVARTQHDDVGAGQRLLLV